MAIVESIRQPAALPAPAAAEELHVVVFELGPQRYGLPVELVREVVPLPALLELAGAAAGLCGLLNRRGAYIPVIAGRFLVGQPLHSSLDSQVVLAGPVEPQVGLLVDRVSGVQRLSAAQAVGLDRRSTGEYFDRVLSTDAGPVLLLYFPALLALAPAVDRPAPR